MKELNPEQWWLIKELVSAALSDASNNHTCELHVKEKYINNFAAIYERCKQELATCTN